MELLGTGVIILGIILMFFGIIGLFRFPNFYCRILVSSKIDTVGAMTVIIGVVIRHGFSFFSLRAILLLGFMLFIDPMVTYLLAHSAYLSGHKLEGIADDKQTTDSAEDTSS